MEAEGLESSEDKIQTGQAEAKELDQAELSTSTSSCCLLWSKTTMHAPTCIFITIYIYTYWLLLTYRLKRKITINTNK